jgi:hypothetical protein
MKGKTKQKAYVGIKIIPKKEKENEGEKQNGNNSKCRN